MKIDIASELCKQDQKLEMEKKKIQENFFYKFFFSLNNSETFSEFKSKKKILKNLERITSVYDNEDYYLNSKENKFSKKNVNNQFEEITLVKNNNIVLGNDNIYNNEVNNLTHLSIYSGNKKKLFF